MSIASQIEDYADGLSDAYAMVAQRGGTMPAQKNMNNLTTAIATIPSGGTPVQPTLTSATYSNGVITLTGSNFGSAPVVKMFNRKYDRYDDITPTTSSANSATIAVGSSDYGYYSRVVKVENGGFESEVKFVYADFENLGASGAEYIIWCYHNNTTKYPLDAYGISIVNSPGSAQRAPSYQSMYQYVYTAWFSSITAVDGQSVSISGLPSTAIRGIEVKTGVTALNAASFPYCHNLNQPLGFANVTSLATSYNGTFIGGSYSFNSPVDVSMVEDFGNGFFAFNSAFNQPLDFSSTTNIGMCFMRYCFAYDQPMTFIGDANTPLTISGDNVFRDMRGMTHPIYFENCSIGGGPYCLYNMASIPSVTFKNTTLASAQTGGLLINQYAVNSSAYIDGVTINGDAASVNTVLTQWPDQALSSNGCRKLIQGTITS